MTKSEFESVISNDTRFTPMEKTDYMEDVKGETVSVFVRDSVTKDYSSLYAICFDSTSVKAKKYSSIKSLFVRFINDKVSWVFITPPFIFDLDETIFWFKSAIKSSALSSYFQGQEKTIESKITSAYRQLNLHPYMNKVATKVVAVGRTSKNEYIELSISNLSGNKNVAAEARIAFGVK